MSHDVFPPTLGTWIGQKLEEGDAGRGEINRHVMTVYSFPLQVYFKGSSDRWLGEADDVVQGFFADRLARADFFAEWQRSGLRLRRWLMNGFCFYLKELRRQRRKERREEDLPEEAADEPVRLDDELDRSFAVSVVRRALEETRAVCEERGLEAHWRVFHLHHYQGKPFKEFAGEMGIDADRASTMARTVATKFRTALRGILARDGANGAEINRELESLLEATGG